MCEKRIGRVLLVLVLGLLLNHSQADLVGHWSLDEGTGTVANDRSGNGNHGTLIGATWVDGLYGKALAFNGQDNYVEIPVADSLEAMENVSAAAWINYIDAGDGWLCALANGQQGGPWETYGLFVNRGGTFVYATVNLDGAHVTHSSPGGVVGPETWHHVCSTWDGSTVKIYVDGNLALEQARSGVLTATGLSLRIGHRGGSSHYFNGIIDDVAVFDHALTEDEVRGIMAGLGDPALAAKPQPEDAAIDVLRDTDLSWAPGDFAAKHDVYFGTSLGDVNDATTPASAGQTDTTYDPGILEFGQTYFWRVDEVNAAPDNTVFKGEVWSFTAEPFSIPVEMITASASSQQAANMGPENTIGGVGLNELDQHSTEGTEMWLSGMGDAAPSIQYDFDRAYKLHELWVWNSNQLIEAFVGLGAKDVQIEYTADGVEWMTLEGVAPFAQATGSASYTANTVVDFGGVLAQAVRLTINSGYGMLPQYGLSEVRFYYIPTLAREAQPADGSVVEAADVVLAWRSGREAASHEVYLGTDPAGLALLGTSIEPSLAANGLDFDTTYYWSVTEINEAETVTAYAGDTWSFITPPFGTVDDFEQYNDDCTRIFFAWEDGLGHNGGEDVDDCDVPPSNGNGGGSIVGHASSPFAEQSIVNAGSSQALPFSYDNAFGDSFATLNLPGQDWTASGIQTLSLAFSGTPGNTGTLYVKINNAKVSYDKEASDIARSVWQVWNIDLAGMAGLQNVTQLAIGVDGASAAGMLYIDDIRLYPQAGEVIAPEPPDDTNLVGHWKFDEGAGDLAVDSSGNGYDGNVFNATWEAGQAGSALVFDGFSYVEVPVQACASIAEQVTVAFWQYVETTPPNNFTFGAFNGGARVCSAHITWGGQAYWDSGDAAGFDRINRPIQDHEYLGDWHHWALVKNAQTGQMAIYLDGTLWHSGDGNTRVMPGADVDGFTIGTQPTLTSSFVGTLDDFRLYDRALSQAEIIALAGRQEIHKPF